MTSPPPPSASPTPPPFPRPRLGKPLMVIGAVLLFIFLIPAMARLITDWMWFREAGFAVVFVKGITARWALGAAAFAIALAIFYSTLRASHRGIVLDPNVV